MNLPQGFDRSQCLAYRVQAKHPIRVDTPIPDTIPNSLYTQGLTGVDSPS